MRLEFSENLNRLLRNSLTAKSAEFPQQFSSFEKRPSGLNRAFQQSVHHDGRERSVRGAVAFSSRLSPVWQVPATNKGARPNNGRATSDVGLFKPIRDYVDTLVHPSARRDALTAARHRAFIAPRLLGSMVAFAALPLYVALRGVPGPLEALVFAWLVLPILTAYYLSRTGCYESAQVLSSLALTGLVAALAAATRGLAAFEAIWLVIVPLEASL
jgi:hypothetical protein